MSGSFGTSNSQDGCDAFTTSSANSGIFAHNDATNPAPAGPGGNGVFGLSTVPNASGVFGANNNGGIGVAGNSDKGDAMLATTKSSAHSGIFAANNDTNPAPAGIPGGNGVFGLSTVPNASGVFGLNNNGGTGVAGNSDKGDAMLATTKSSAHSGIFAANNDINPAPAGIPGGNGVFGVSTVPNASGVFGLNNNGGSGVAGSSDKGMGIHGFGRVAGRFEGDVEVTGDIRLINGDCAEDFDIFGAEKIEPGTVMVLGDEGKLQPSGSAYDKRVTGVISGAGNFKPGIVLDKQQNQTGRQPIALLGKVYCKVDASFGPVEIGDLLTTSPTWPCYEGKRPIQGVRGCNWQGSATAGRRSGIDSDLNCIAVMREERAHA